MRIHHHNKTTGLSNMQSVYYYIEGIIGKQWYIYTHTITIMCKQLASLKVNFQQIFQNVKIIIMLVTHKITQNMKLIKNGDKNDNNYSLYIIYKQLGTLVV